MAGEGTPIGALAVRIGADATELLESFGKANKATKDLGGGVTALQGTLKGLAAALAPAAVLAWVQSMANAADQAGKTAQKVGLTVEALSELQYSAKLADVSNEQLTGGLGKLAKSMQEAQLGAGDAAVAFRALGIQVTEHVNGPLRGTDAVFFELADRFAKMEDGAGKTALAMRIFGRSGAELIPLLNQGAEGLRRNAEEARRFGVVISGDVAKNAEEFNDNLRRLKASSEGLALQLAGPLVKALADASGAMVKAKLEGESMFETWKRGLAEFLTGNDLYKWSKDLVQAEEALRQAQNQLDRAKHAASSDNAKLWPEEAARGVAKYEAAVRRAKEEVDRLMRVKPVLFEPDKAPPDQRKPAPILEDNKNAEREARQLQEAADEEIRIQLEVYGIIAAARDKDLSDQKRILDERMQAIMDAEDRRQEFEIEAGRLFLEAQGELHTTRLEQLRQSQMSAQELENEAYRKRLEQLQQFSDAELEALGGRQAVEQQMALEHQDRINDIRRRGLNNLADFNKASWGDQTKHMIGALAEMTASAANHNRGMFEINKLASTANAIVKGWEAVQSSYAFGASWGGPVAGAAMAGLAAAATLVNVMAIKNATFGGGVAPSFASTAAPPVQPVAQSQAGPLQTFVIKLSGLASSSQDTLAELNDRLRNGGRVIFT